MTIISEGADLGLLLEAVISDAKRKWLYGSPTEQLLEYEFFIGDEFRFYANGAIDGITAMKVALRNKKITSSRRRTYNVRKQRLVVSN